MSKNSIRQTANQVDSWREWFMKSYHRKPVKQNPKFGKRK